VTAPTAVFDLDGVLLQGNAVRLFLAGRLRRSPARALPLAAAAPLLALAAAAGPTRPAAARAVTWLAGSSGETVADHRAAIAAHPEVVIADALARLRAHRAAGDRVVVATAAEETLARGFLAALGLGDIEVVGSTGWRRRPVRLHGATKARALVDRGFPPPWTAVYSDSVSDLPLFAGTPRPVLVNAPPAAAARVARVLGAAPVTCTWH
jgi:phosphatidylglycerophosphatase C